MLKEEKIKKEAKDAAKSKKQDEEGKISDQEEVFKDIYAEKEDPHKYDILQ